MRKLTSGTRFTSGTSHRILIAALFAASFAALPAAAHGGGGGGGGNGHSDAGGTSFGAPNMGGSATESINGAGGFGGHSMSHMSAQGSQSTNGPDSSDRDFGTDRAGDRNGRDTDAEDTASTTATTSMSHGHHGHHHSSLHGSARSLANSNGPNASDRDFGRDRAGDRNGKDTDAEDTMTGTATSSTSMGHAHFGGRSSLHESSASLANSNGPNATMREHGKARAHLRAALNASRLHHHVHLARMSAEESHESSAAQLNERELRMLKKHHGV